MASLLLLSLLLLSTPPPFHCSCDPSHRHLLSLAFSSIANFHLPPPSPCITHLHLPSLNLSGTLSWLFLRNITTLQSLDLSSNSLQGSIPSTFWSAAALSAVNLAGNRLGGSLRFDPSGLTSLNLSNNRFTAVFNSSLLKNLKALDLSHNNLGFTPNGLNSLSNIQYLDLSYNSMRGKFPNDFPAIAGLQFLNLSHNNLTGEIDSAAMDKFGSSAFAKGGIFTFVEEKKQGKEKALKTKLIAALIVGAAIIAALVAGGLYWCKKRLPEKGEIGEEEMGWVREAKWGAKVVIFEKPLMELTFGDLAKASAGFGRESLMAERGRGRIYRAVLRGDVNVVVRVMERDSLEEEELREVGRLRHRNLLPLMGYCVSG